MENYFKTCPCMTLTDELDMVGVELGATWTATRKVNGDALQKGLLGRQTFGKVENSCL